MLSQHFTGALAYSYVNDPISCLSFSKEHLQKQGRSPRDIQKHIISLNIKEHHTWQIRVVNSFSYWTTHHTVVEVAHISKTNNFDSERWLVLRPLNYHTHGCLLP